MLLLTPARSTGTCIKHNVILNLTMVISSNFSDSKIHFLCLYFSLKMLCSSVLFLNQFISYYLIKLHCTVYSFFMIVLLIKPYMIKKNCIAIQAKIEQLWLPAELRLSDAVSIPTPNNISSSKDFWPASSACCLFCFKCKTCRSII